MPRYEFVQGTSSKFWEITLDGSEFTTTYGKIGTDGKSTTKAFDSPEQAQKEYDKLIGQKTKKGYVLAGSADAPQDGKERLHGLEQETQGGNDEPAERFVFRPVVTYDPEKGLGQAGRGAAYAVRLEEPWDQGLEEFLGLLDQLLADPRVGELKALVLGGWGSAELTGGTNDSEIYQRLLAAKGRLGALSAVFVADVTQEETECSWIHLNDYGQLLALPALEHLRVRGNGSPQAPLQSATLRSLCLQTGGLPRTTAQAVASASFPELEHLEPVVGH
ncbi:MAG: WGR domain-containing protein [Planctomycetota bacterium]